MASNNVTSYKDDLEALNKALLETQQRLEAVAKTAIDIDKELQKNKKSYSETSSIIQKVNSDLDVLAKAEKEVESIQKKTMEVVAKARAERSEENKTLLKAQAARTEQNKKIKESIALEKSEAESLNRLRAQNKELIKERNKLSTATEKGRAKIAEINKQLDANNAKIKANSSNLEKQKINIGNYQSALSGLPGTMGNVARSAQMVGKQLLVLMTNPIIAIVAGIAAAFTGLYKALTRNEEGANKLNKVFAGLKAAFAVIADRVTVLANKIFDAFTDPQQAVKDLWEVIKTNIVNRIEGLVAVFTNLGTVASSSFKLVIAAIKRNKDEVEALKVELKEAGKAAGQAFVQLNTGLDTDQQKKFIEGLKEITDEVKNETKEASNLQDRRNKLEIAERNFIVTKAKLNAEIAKARELTQDESVSLEERMRLNKEALDLTDQLYSKEVEFAQERASIAAEEIALGESSAEELRKSEELKAAAFEAEVSRSNQRKRLLAEQRALQTRLNKELPQEGIDAYEKYAQGIAESNLAILQNTAYTEEQKANLIKENADKLLDMQIEYARLSLEQSGLSEKEKFDLYSEYIDLKIQKEEQLTAKKEAENAKRVQSEQDYATAAIGIAGSVFSFLDTIYEQDLKNLEAKNERGTLSDKEYARERAKIERKQAEAKKYEGIFNAIVNTATGITSALSLGVPGIILAVLIAALGAVQIATIASEPLPQIPSYKYGTKNHPGGVAKYAEAGAEILKIPGHGMRLVEEPTIGYLPPGTEVIPNWDIDKVLQGGSTVENYNAFAEEQKRTRRAIENLRNESTNINGDRWSTTVAVGTTRKAFINKYFRG